MQFVFSGVIGPEKSSEAEAISCILGGVPESKRLLQIGFSATAAKLGNRKEYNNFARVIPNDNIQFEVFPVLFTLYLLTFFNEFVHLLLLELSVFNFWDISCENKGINKLKKKQSK